MSSMEFLLFDQEAYEATLAKWSEEAEKYDCFPNEVQDRLSVVVKSLSERDKKNSHTTMAYGVFVPGGKVASCICDLVLSDRGGLAGKWLKFLKITLSPEIDALLANGDDEAVNIAIQSYKAAVLGAFSARLDHDAATLKLYGRTDEQLKFLMTMLSVLNQEGSSTISATREGRWLVLRSDKGGHHGIQ